MNHRFTLILSRLSSISVARVPRVARSRLFFFYKNRPQEGSVRILCSKIFLEQPVSNKSQPSDENPTDPKYQALERATRSLPELLPNLLLLSSTPSPPPSSAAELSYLEFCRAGTHHGCMKQVLPQALRFPPTVLDLWIYAVAWEFDHKPQRHHRTRPHAVRPPMLSNLWLHFLRMDLTFLNKLRDGKAALGLALCQQGDDVAFTSFNATASSSSSSSSQGAEVSLVTRVVSQVALGQPSLSAIFRICWILIGRMRFIGNMLLQKIFGAEDPDARREA